MTPLELSPLEPLVLGDGRPFAQEAGAGSAGGLLVPPPSAFAGAVRAAVGRGQGGSPDWKAIESTEVHGPLVAWGDALWLPLPADAVPMERDGKPVLVRARPTDLEPGESTDLGGASLPLLPNAEGLKPTKAKPPAWVPLPWLASWYGEEVVPLVGAPDDDERSPLERFCRDEAPQAKGAPAPVELDARAHVGIGFETLTAEKGLLFATKGAAYAKGARLVGRCAEMPRGSAAFVGGERRQAALAPGDAGLWACLPEVRQGLADATRVALVLATPALFDAGDLPNVEALSRRLGVGLKLLGSAHGTRVAVSGWRMQAPRGPKPARWLVPAGGVYWFEVAGDPAKLADAWLAPVSDAEADRRDGLGLGLWFPTLL